MSAGQWRFFAYQDRYLFVEYQRQVFPRLFKSALSQVLDGLGA